MSAKHRAMYPFSFEGQAHQRPAQSYAGNDQKKCRDELLKHLEDERRRRERSRQCEAASTKIQSSWRGTIIRKARQEQLASTFRKTVEKMKSLNNSYDSQLADTLIRCMVFSRIENLPEEDLHWFAAQVLKDISNFFKVIVLSDSTGEPILYRLKAFLLHILARICPSSRPTIALRLLELFLDSSTYAKYFPIDFADKAAKRAVQYLIDHNFYATLCQTLLSKSDVGMELLPNQEFPGGFAGAILQLMLLPLRVAKTEEISNLVMKHLVFDVICRPEPLAGRLIVPSFLARDVPLAIVISKCFLSNRSQVAELQPITFIHVTWGFLNSLTKIDCSKLLEDDALRAIECLALLMRHLPAQDRQDEHISTRMQTDDSDDESDEETAHYVSQLTQSDYAISSSIWASLPEYAKRWQAEVVEMICSDRNFAGFLHRLINNSKTGSPNTQDGDRTCQIAMLFHELIFRHGITPGKMRGSSLPVFDKELLRRFYRKIIALIGPIKYPVQVTLLQRIQSGLPLHQLEYDLLVPIFTIFTKFFHWLLLCVNDAEFLDQSSDSRVLIPFSTSELIEITANFRKVCAGLVDVLSPSRFLGPSMKNENLVISPKQYIAMFKSACHLLKHLYSRNCRLNFLPEGFWSSVLSTVQPVYPPPFGLISYLLQPFTNPDMLLTGDYVEQGLDPSIARAFTANEIHLAIVLTNVPFLLPFEYRYDVFRAVLSRDRDANFRSRPMGLDDGLTIDIRIRRQYLYEDAFEKLSLENAPNLKKRIRCQLMNFTGLDEAGIDGGGLFREFMTELIRTAFDPNRGLFCFTQTEKDCRLYPNPAAEMLYPDNWKAHFFFLGRIVGKMLYEKILVELPMADFFLAKILSRDFASLDVHHLADLDPVLYKNLLFLKTYAGNVEDLGLDFTIVDDSQMASENPRVVELIPNGKNVPVSAENRILYTHLVADYKLNRRISAQCRAFVEGLSHVVNIDWLRMFSPPELQTLISGAEKPINVNELMNYTRYGGIYDENHPTVKLFWSIVKHRMTENQRRMLLKFVTSCSRPPMFGFKDLEPPFTIHPAGPPDQNGPGVGGLRLPSASTCINLLKLPEYTDEDALFERLCYAIESGSGFELS